MIIGFPFFSAFASPAVQSLIFYVTYEGDAAKDNPRGFV